MKINCNIFFGLNYQMRLYDHLPAASSASNVFLYFCKISRVILANLHKKPGSHSCAGSGFFFVFSASGVLRQDFALRCERHDAHGNVLSACRDSLPRGVFQPTAARHLHACERHAAHVVLRQDGRQLFRIVRAVELRTADERDAAADKVRMELPQA